jgi:hypothetical protein
MLEYNNLQYKWNYGGLIQQILDENGNTDICNIIKNKNKHEFIINNINTLDDFTYPITGRIVMLFDYLQVNFMEKFVIYLIDNKLNFPSITFPPYISSELVKHKEILVYLQTNKITCNNIILTKEHKVNDYLLRKIKQTPNQCITDISNKNISDEGLKKCIYLQKLDAFENPKITTCRPFAKTLIELNASWNWGYNTTDNDCGINDKGLNNCIALQKLNASNNPKITTCYPFAKTLIELDVGYECGINDKGLNNCIALQKLDAYYNRKITTCQPFAKTLIELIAQYSNIDDEGLKDCVNLQKLHAFSSFKITTCQPFAKSLIDLDAGACGITNEGIKDCVNLQILHAGQNSKITTCYPFAKTLIKLNASYNHGMTDEGIKDCVNLQILDADNNQKITTCKPFAKTLIALDARRKCGIDDEGIKDCSHLRRLNADYNPKITTCKPFANTLIVLTACCDYKTDKSNFFNIYEIGGYEYEFTQDEPCECGIGDEGIKKCVNLQTLDASNNPKITTCYPFAKTLIKLIATNECGIGDEEIEDCVNLQTLDADSNPKITTHHSFLIKPRQFYEYFGDI